MAAFHTNSHIRMQKSLKQRNCLLLVHCDHPGLKKNKSKQQPSKTPRTGTKLQLINQFSHLCLFTNQPQAKNKSARVGLLFSRMGQNKILFPLSVGVPEAFVRGYKEFPSAAESHHHQILPLCMSYTINGS